MNERERNERSLAERLAAEPAQWLNLGEAAAHVGVSSSTLREMILHEGIPHRKVGSSGSRWVIERAVLDEHLRTTALEHVAVSQ